MAQAAAWLVMRHSARIQETGLGSPNTSSVWMAAKRGVTGEVQLEVVDQRALAQKLVRQRRVVNRLAPDAVRGDGSLERGEIDDDMIGSTVPL